MGGTAGLSLGFPSPAKAVGFIGSGFMGPRTWAAVASWLGMAGNTRWGDFFTARRQVGLLLLQVLKICSYFKTSLSCTARGFDDLRADI